MKIKRRQREREGKVDKIDLEEGGGGTAQLLKVEKEKRGEKKRLKELKVEMKEQGKDKEIEIVD